MCGIIGIIGENKHLIQELNQLQIHRGPDFNNTFITENIALGHTRLAVIDEETDSNQPMSSNCENYVLIFNGEIFNHLIIREKLSNKNFKTKSDTETLLYLLIEFGIDSIKYLNGFFSFIFLDKKNNKILIGRDEAGIKPLYYHKLNGNFYIASEIKVIKKLVKTTPNKNSIKNYIKFHWTTNFETQYNEIQRFPIGEIWEYDLTSDTLIKKKYEKEIIKSTASINECVTKLDSLLHQVIIEELCNTQPVAFLLSGGLDSSLLVAIAKKHLPYSIDCFTYKSPSIFFTSNGFEDDFNYAKKIAEYLNVNLITTNINHFQLQEILDINKIVEEPIADFSSVNLFHICSKIKEEKYKILASGVGSDELFGGYRRHRLIEPFSFVQKNTLLKIFLKFISELTPAKLRRFKKALQILSSKSDEEFLSQSFSYINEDFSALLNKNEIDSNSNLPFKTLESLEKSMYNIEKNNFLPNNNLLYFDKISMFFSIEGRVPYLNKKIVEFAESIPKEYKKDKLILRNVAKNYLPNEIIQRKKTGFSTPMNEVCKHINILEIEKQIHKNFFNSKKIKNVEYKKTIQNAQLLYSILCINEFID